jgi:hypothetical protein
MKGSNLAVLLAVLYDTNNKNWGPCRRFGR